MITRDDVVVRSAFDLVSQQYLIQATLTVQAQGTTAVEGPPVDAVSQRLQRQVWNFVYGDVRRKLDKAEERCWKALMTNRPAKLAFDEVMAAIQFDEVRAAIQSVRDVLDGKGKDD